jgi:hypothetical protein
MWWMNTISIQCCLLNLFWFQTRIGDQKGLKMVVLFSVVSESVELLCQASSFFLPRVSRTCWRCIHHHRLHNKITCLFKFLSIDWMCGICSSLLPITSRRYTPNYHSWIHSGAISIQSLLSNKVSPAAEADIVPTIEGLDLEELF